MFFKRTFFETLLFHTHTLALTMLTPLIIARAVNDINASNTAGAKRYSLFVRFASTFVVESDPMAEKRKGEERATHVFCILGTTE
jgi:hypothetical protein